MVCEFFVLLLHLLFFCFVHLLSLQWHALARARSHTHALNTLFLHVNPLPLLLVLGVGRHRRTAVRRSVFGTIVRFVQYLRDPHSPFHAHRSFGCSGVGMNTLRSVDSATGAYNVNIVSRTHRTDSDQSRYRHTT